jgi:hypothetical protein
LQKQKDLVRLHNSENCHESYRTCNHVQLYTANAAGPRIGKNGGRYLTRGAICMETQYFNNSRMLSTTGTFTNTGSIVINAGTTLTVPVWHAHLNRKHKPHKGDWTAIQFGR